MSETAAPDDALLADIEEAMRDVVDPELGINVVDLGLVYDMLEATLALATIIRRTEIQSVSEEFPMIVPFTTVAAEPILARTRIRPTRGT